MQPITWPIMSTLPITSIVSSKKIQEIASILDDERSSKQKNVSVIKMLRMDIN